MVGFRHKGANAAAESFFSLLKFNVLNSQRWDTRTQQRTETSHCFNG